jgi:hypothetical protein
LYGKSDVNGATGGEGRQKRWITPDVAIRITGHKTGESLRKSAKVYGQFGYKKLPTGQLQYDLDGCLAYAGATEADFADLLAGTVTENARASASVTPTVSHEVV